MGRGQYKMSTVSRLTGFKPELLRAWETRHHLLAPERGPGGQRLYTDADLAILQHVRTLLAEGRSIGEIAALGRRHLLESARQTPAPSTTELPRAVPAWVAPARSDGAAARALDIAAKAVGRLSTRLDAGQVLQLVTDTLATDFQSALARVWVAQPGGHVLLLRASSGLSRRTATSPRARIDLTTYKYKVGVVARTGQPFVSNQILGDTDFDQRWVNRERLASVAVLPLVADDQLQGVMASFFRVALNEELVGALKIFSTIAANSLAAQPLAKLDAA